MGETQFQPRRFFEVVLAALLAEKRAATVDSADVIQLYLTGETDSAWFIDLGDDPPGVYEGEAEASDLTIAIAEHQVLPLLLGQLDTAAAIADESLQVAGERRALETFARLFGDTLSGMGVLYASVRQPR